MSLESMPSFPDKKKPTNEDNNVKGVGEKNKHYEDNNETQIEGEILDLESNLSELKQLKEELGGEEGLKKLADELDEENLKNISTRMSEKAKDLEKKIKRLAKAFTPALTMAAITATIAITQGPNMEPEHIWASVFSLGFLNTMAVAFSSSQNKELIQREEKDKKWKKENWEDSADDEKSQRGLLKWSSKKIYLEYSDGTKIDFKIPDGLKGEGSICSRRISADANTEVISIGYHWDVPEGGDFAAGTTEWKVTINKKTKEVLINQEGGGVR
jgi:hypothetical protein